MKSRAVDWFFLFRPWSFTATLIPFLVAAGIGSRQGEAQWGGWAVGLLSGILFQATTNLLNTWGDEKSGVDNVPGAIRTTPQVHDGRVSMTALLRTAIGCVTLASLLGLSTCFFRSGGHWRFNAPLVFAGLIGFLGATNYTTGLRFKYRGLGVPFVSFLMGPLETFVAWTILLPVATPQLLKQLTTSPSLLACALFAVLPVATLVGAILHGNDMRDMPTDRKAGIVTFALRLGVRGALVYYLLCHSLPYLFTFGAFLMHAHLSMGPNPLLLLPLLTLPISLRTAGNALRVYRDDRVCPPWRGLERDSGKVLLAYGILHALSLSLR